MIPSMALEEYNTARKNPRDNNPLLGVFKKSFKNFCTARNVLRSLIRSLASKSNCGVIDFEIGMYGSSVQRKITAAGIAMRKLNAIADALSFKPTFFTCLKKNATTSYSGRP